MSKCKTRKRIRERTPNQAANSATDWSWASCTEIRRSNAGPCAARLVHELKTKDLPQLHHVALILATIGLYAVVAHSVSQRTKEIGVRMAIGAAAADVRKMVVREGMRPVAMGMVTGLVASLGVNRVLQSQLVGVAPYDPLTMATAPLLLVTISLLACQIGQAVSVDPSVALRHD